MAGLSINSLKSSPVYGAGGGGGEMTVTQGPPGDWATR